ncbi:LIC_10190 family membrane protein [Flavobacterium aciduliphilum]|uniref:DUF8201 domain-containing protein n=1 Tax=Flavobacterium aciduliphilum TaxID=1101402 RepID=A0A328YQY8_9FLAO|nr:hypothetical protein [Flavobacterium aciduliphilum]RAR75543.1 hypothetical protein CLV55_101243 [Flavobacterium aciduliphilum]
MILIFLSWIYIFFTTITLGIGLGKIVSIKTNGIITSIFGLITTTILASIWAIFGRINVEFHSTLLLLNSVITIVFFREIRDIFKIFYKDFTQLYQPFKLLFIINSIIILAQCAAPPYIIDNESYYIQTIKWLNEYGLVKGLANVHIFFGQTSGWHILQSAFNFSFLYKNFNDLSGFFLLLATAFSFKKLNNYLTNGNKVDLCIGILMLAQGYFLQFISAPSPDLPIYWLTFIIFYIFLKKYNKPTVEDTNLILLLVTFLLYIKPIYFTLLILPIAFGRTLFRTTFKKTIPTVTIAFLFGVLLVVKNCLLTGYPLFPLTTFSIPKIDYAVPNHVLQYHFSRERLYRFFITKNEFHTLTTLQIFLKAIFFEKISTFFYFLTFGTLIITPWSIYKFGNKKSLWILYSVFCFQLIFLIWNAPLYRFFIHFTLLFISINGTTFLSIKPKFITPVLGFSTLLLVILVFIPLNLSLLTHNKLLKHNAVFMSEQLLFPYKNSKENIKYKKETYGNLTFYSPVQNDFFWRTGDGDLPCVNKQQIDFFAKKLKIIPQKRSSSLADGFYSKPILENDPIRSQNIP